MINRLIDIAEKSKLALFSERPDMPFADPTFADKIAEMLSYRLDFVRAMNLPLGLSAELYSAEYLQKLYQRMSNPFQSEYLGWFVV